MEIKKMIFSFLMLCNLASTIVAIQSLSNLTNTTHSPLILNHAVNETALINFQVQSEIEYDEGSEVDLPFCDHYQEGYEFGVDGPLKVAVTFSETESLYKTRLPNGKLVDIYGSSNVAYAFLLDLQELFNFTIEIVESYGWMTPGQNDTITGTGYQILSGKADISIDISKPVLYRAKHLNFLHAIKQDQVAIMFRQPKVQIYRNILSRPFRGGLWKCVLGSWLVLFVVTAVTAWKSISDLHDLLLPVTATILARGVNMSSLFQGSKRSLSVVILVASLFGLTMYSIYSAFIVSSLKRAEAPVRKFHHLINFEYELIAQRSLPDFTNVYVHDKKKGNYFAEKARKNFVSIEDTLQRLFYDPNDDNDTTDISLKLNTNLESNTNVAWFALKSDFAYLSLQNGYTTRQICEISQLDPVVRAEHPRVLAMFIGKNNTKIKEHFNRRILDILARGLGRRHVQRFENEFQPKCGDPIRRVTIKQIRFYDVYAAHALLIGGALAALSIWIVGEIILPYLWHAKCKLFKQKWKYEVGEVTMKKVTVENWGIPRIILVDCDLTESEQINDVD